MYVKNPKPNTSCSGPFNKYNLMVGWGEDADGGDPEAEDPGEAGEGDRPAEGDRDLQASRTGIFCSILDPYLNPDPNQPDPHVFGPLGSGSGSFYHQATIVRKTLIRTVLWPLLNFLSLKNDVNVPSKSYKQKNFFKSSFLLASGRSMTRIAGSRSASRIH